MQKNCKTNQKQFRINKLIERKGDRLYVKWKNYDNFLTVGLTKNITLYKRWVIFHLMVIIKTK